MSRSLLHSPTAGWHRQACIALGVGLSFPLILAAREAEAVDRPRVLVRFEASIPPFSGLQKPVRLALGAHVAEKAVATFAKSWRFVEWAAASEESGAPAAGWVWEVRVEAEACTISRPNGPPATDSILRLRHRVGRADGAATSWEEIETQHPKLYDVGQFKPSGAQDLQRDLDRLIERQFTTDFLRQVEARFLRKIPLGDRILVDAAGQRVIIPLRRCELHVGEESQLEARFKTETGASVAREDKLRLKAARAVEGGSYAGWVYGPVVLLDSPPHYIDNAAYWNPLFPRVLGSVRDVRVFMYSSETDTADGGLVSNGVILDPDACGGQR